MSCLATVTIFECDGCKQIIALKFDEDWLEFEETWCDTLLHQYCSICKTNQANRAVIQRDLKYMESISQRKDETFTEFVH